MSNNNNTNKNNKKQTEINSYFTEKNDQKLLYKCMSIAFKTNGLHILDNKSIVSNMILIANDHVSFNDYVKSSFSFKMMKHVFQSKTYSRKQVRGLWLLCRYLGDLKMNDDNHYGRCKATFQTMLQPGKKTINVYDYAIMLRNQILPNLEELKSHNDGPPPTNEQYLATAETIYEELFNGNIEKGMTFRDYLKLMEENQMALPISQYAESIREEKFVSFERKGSVYKKSISPKKSMLNQRKNNNNTSSSLKQQQQQYENVSMGKKVLLMAITEEDEFY